MSDMSTPPHADAASRAPGGHIRRRTPHSADAVALPAISAEFNSPGSQQHPAAIDHTLVSPAPPAPQHHEDDAPPAKKLATGPKKTHRERIVSLPPISDLRVGREDAKSVCPIPSVLAKNFLLLFDMSTLDHSVKSTAKGPSPLTQVKAYAPITIDGVTWTHTKIGVVAWGNQAIAFKDILKTALTTSTYNDSALVLLPGNVWHMHLCTMYDPTDQYATITFRGPFVSSGTNPPPFNERTTPRPFFWKEHILYVADLPVDKPPAIADPSDWIPFANRSTLPADITVSPFKQEAITDEDL